MITAATVLATIMMVIQVGVWAYGQHVANTAARQGAQRAAAADLSVGQGQAYSQQFVARAGGNWIVAPSVTASSSGALITVTVTGEALRIIPVPWTLDIAATATSPAEIFVEAR